MKDESAELNDITGNGGQLLPILWLIKPEDIIDTSDITVGETIAQLDIILSSHGINARPPEKEVR